MTTQELLTQLDASPYSEQTRQEIRAAIGDTAEFTPELRARVLELMQKDIDADLGAVTIDTPQLEALEHELSTSLDAIESEAKADVETVEHEVRELADLSQKVDVLERLHA